MAVPQTRPDGPTTHERSTAELVHDLTELVPRLVREEIALATTELKQKGRTAAAGAGMFGAAGVLAWFGVGVLVATAVMALALVLPGWLAGLIVGVVIFAVAGLLALTGRRRMTRALPPTPSRTIRNVKDDVETVKRSAHR
jgi:hypothetical protein